MADRRVIHFNVQSDDLTPDQSAHIEEIGVGFCTAMANKYIVGQREHGGNLWEMKEGELLDNAINEAIDQVVYLLTLKRRLYGDLHGKE